MKWINRNDDESNYEDRRGRSTGRRLAAGGGIGTIIILALYMFTGQDFSSVADMFTGGEAQTETVDPSRAKENEDLKVFSLGVFNSANDVWTKIFNEQMQMEYRKPTFVTFTDQTMSECGGASGATGPFYCPGDEKVYIDLSFFHELATRFKAPGDLAMAYVTAHEVGHHVQKLLGITDKMQQYRGRISEEEYNQLSVRLELQADFYAGLWARYAEAMNIIKLEEGDIESALGAANAVGDDTIQKQAQGYTVPDSFTHGTSAQRMRWFMKGYQTGDYRQGDTFNAETL
ncbi:MAG TPA: neutral zinc metallopeptidase [Paludibacteraceae bacterium]|nr:neutral zinc metallopeptidase [Paludibacteraceae bacterium]